MENNGEKASVWFQHCNKLKEAVTHIANSVFLCNAMISCSLLLLLSLLSLSRCSQRISIDSEVTRSCGHLQRTRDRACDSPLQVGMKPSTAKVELSLDRSLPFLVKKKKKKTFCKRKKAWRLKLSSEEYWYLRLKVQLLLMRNLAPEAHSFIQGCHVYM